MRFSSCCAAPSQALAPPSTKPHTVRKHGSSPIGRFLQPPALRPAAAGGLHPTHTNNEQDCRHSLIMLVSASFTISPAMPYATMTEVSTEKGSTPVKARPAARM